MKSTAKHVMALLVTGRYGYEAGTTDTYSTGWPIFVREQPSNPRKCVVLREYEGPPPTVAINADSTEKPYETLRFQLSVRAETDDAAHSKIRALYNFLAKHAGWTVADDEDVTVQSRYDYIICDTPPFPLATEERGVYIWICNFRTARQDEAVS